MVVLSSEMPVNVIAINSSQFVDIAGLEFVNKHNQGNVIYLSAASNDVNVHHNRFIDYTKGDGTTSLIHSIAIANGHNHLNVEFQYNRVNRFWQTGVVNFNRVEHNELYLDSWSNQAVAIKGTDATTSILDNHKTLKLK